MSKPMICEAPGCHKLATERAAYRARRGLSGEFLLCRQHADAFLEGKPIVFRALLYSVYAGDLMQDLDDHPE